MKTNIYLLFSTYGEVIQVRMRETQKLRGQAFVVFREQRGADSAKVELEQSDFFGKKLVIDYAKSMSDETRRQHQEAQSDFDPNFNYSHNVSLQKVIAERRKKRKHSYGEQRLHKREMLLEQEKTLLEKKDE